MRIEIATKNYKPNDHLKGLIEKKISRFDKYFDKEADIKVMLIASGQNYNRYTMEITLNSGSMRVRSEVTSDNMYDNIDIILPKIERQIVKYRKKFEAKLRKGAFREPYIYEESKSAEDDQQVKGKIVKIKNFEIAMTTVENAVEEMELLEHNFYVFINEETAKVNVVYKRNDGDYGLISPEY
ncbi:MAG: ribosome hibernation-promoting factor, HPF/YfiA family [Bacillota bacterium]